MSDYLTLNSQLKQVLNAWKLQDKKTKNNQFILNVLLDEDVTNLEELLELEKEDFEQLNFKLMTIKKITKKIKELKNRKFCKYIYNPYIILIGISDYSLLNDNKYKNLDATKNDVNLMLSLWKNIYSFEHVVSVQDKINNKTLDEDNFNNFLIEQRNNIIILCKNKNVKSPDCVLIYFAGHGHDKTILFGDGSSFSYKSIKMIFDNQMLICMASRPKMYFFDCMYLYIYVTFYTLCIHYDYGCILKK